MILRPAEPADAMAVAHVHVRSWQVGYRTLLPIDFLNALRPEDRAARYTFATLDVSKPRTIVAVEDGAIVGFASTSPSHEEDLPDHGELCALYVDPPHWGHGVGRTLISAARAHLYGMGFRKALLWMLAGNVRAERFYRADGWVPDGVERTDSTRGVPIHDVRYQRKLDAS